LEDTYFYDTYALIELFQLSPSYMVYSKCKIITTYFQLYELYYNLRKMYSDEEINEYFETIKAVCISLDPSWIKEATEFRLKNKSLSLSYTDCLGYVAAKRVGIHFLTGDKEFRNMPNVEFVK